MRIIRYVISLFRKKPKEVSDAEIIEKISESFRGSRITPSLPPMDFSEYYDD